MRSLDEVRALLAQRRGDAVPGPTMVTPEPRAARPQLSSAQRGIWAHQQLDPRSSAYNLCLRMTLTTAAGTEPIDEDRLVEAFGVLVRRHEVLRTTYPSGPDGEPWQQVHDDLEPEVRRYAPGADLAEITRNAATRPFDLAVDSPIRLDLVRPDPGTLVVVMTLQHIVWDGMTMSVLARDLSAAYAGEKLPELTWQVVDFAAQEAAPSTAERAYWAQVFTDGIPQLPLPTVDDATGAGARRDYRLSHDADTNLRRLAGELRVSPFAVFIAAYHLALRLVSGQPRTVIGTTVANREQPGQELLFGNFSNQIPLLIDSSSSSDISFGDLVAKTAQVISGAFRHKLLPADAISAAAGLDRSVGDELFRTMVLFLTRDIAGPRFPGTACTWELIDNEAALYPLAVEAFHHPDHTEVQFTHQRVLCADVVDAVADLLDTVLASATAQCPVTELLRPGRADQDFLAQHAAGPRRVIEPVTVDAMLRQAASRAGQHRAVVICDPHGREQTCWTYAQFDAQVNRLTRELLAHGVATGDRVLVVTGRVAQLPVALAAVLRAGACYVPVDPAFPVRRIRAMTDDADPCLVLLAGPAPRDPDSYGTVPLLDLDCPEVIARVQARGSDAVAPQELTRPLTGEDGCYLIYTSGSTGQPKGVLNHHRGVANHLQWYGQTFLQGRCARVLHKAPVTFDVGLAELLHPLSSGGTAVLPCSQWWQADVAALVNMVAEQRIQVLSLVPSYLRVILDTVEDPGRMRCLEQLLLGGEAVPGNLATRARDLLGCRVHSLYGPTEAAMDVTGVEFTPELAVAAGENLIGRPEDNVTVRLLDRYGHEVPVGVPGELCLVGVQVADGYRNLPEETAAAFGVSPIEADGGARMYRTGDIASWRRDGQLVYHGRIGEQVKVRGNRVELGEVEAALLEVPGVRQAAARVWRDRLVGYLVLSPGTRLGIDEVRQIMGRRVPSYLVVEAIVELSALPLNSHGKLDRGALAEPELSLGTGEELRGVEVRVAEVLAQTLGLAGLPRAADSLFSLGGDSIAAIRVVAGLRRLGLEVSARSVLGARSVTELAAQCREVTNQEPDPGPSRAPLPPLAAQLVATSPQGGGLVQFTAFVPDPATTVPELTRRLNQLLRQHPVLGARLMPEGWLELPEEPAVVVLEQDEQVSIVDRESLTRAAQGLARGIDPSQGRMLAAGLFGTAARQCLVVVISHLVVDGVSWRVLRQEFAEPAHGDPENGFLRWAALLADHTEHDEDRRWLGILRRAAGRIALDPEVDVEQTASTHDCTLDLELTQGLIAAARELGCDLLDLQLAAAVRAVHLILPGAGTGITLEGHGRDNPTALAARAENAVGWFTAAYPLPVTPESTPLSTLWAVRTARRGLPGDTARPGLLRREHHITAPELCLNYLGVFESGASATAWQPPPGVPAVSGWASAGTPLASVLDLTTQLSQLPDGHVLRATLRAAGRHLDPQQAERLLTLWRRELADLVDAAGTDPGRCPADFVAAGITEADVQAWAGLLGAPIREVLPLTALQRSLLLSCLATGGADGYIVQSTLEVNDDARRLNADLLRRAGDILVGHHPSMGIAPLTTTSGTPVGVVTSGLCVPTVEVELEDREVAAWLARDTATTFDFSRPPLLRLALLRTGTSCHIVITCHHLITDGWTGQLLMLELARVLSALLGGDEQQAERQVVGDPGTFARAVARISAQQEQTRQAWAAVLEGVRPVILAGRRQTAAPSRLLTARLATEDVQRLSGFAAQARVSLNLVCQLAWACVLGRITGDESVIFGEVVSGRTVEVPGIEESIGCYANTVPAPVTLAPGSSWRQALTGLATRRRRVIGWEHLPLVDAHRMASVRRLFDTLYVFQSYPAQHRELAATLGAAGLPLVGVRPGGSTDASAVLMIFPSGSVGEDDTLRCSLYTACDVLDEEQSRIMLDIVLGALKAMATDPDQRIQDCQLVDDFDRLALDALRLDAANRGNP